MRKMTKYIILSEEKHKSSWWPEGYKIFYPIENFLFKQKFMDTSFKNIISDLERINLIIR